MVIIGAKGFAKEVLQVFYDQKSLTNLVFFDDTTKNIEKKLFNQFPIITSIEELANYFNNYGKEYTLGVGSPYTRLKLYQKINRVGGLLVSSTSPKASIGSFDTTIGQGVNIMSGTTITNSISIGKGCLINLHCTIGHDTIIDDFTELSPGVHISGNCTIGKLCSIGTNATILPNIKIGNNVIVGAGSTITKDIPDNSLVYGSPGKIIKQLPIQNI